MASKLLTKGSELYGKKKGDPELGLLAGWAGSEMKGGDGVIASCSKGRQYQGMDGGSMHRRCAPQRVGKALTKDMSGSDSKGREGYGKV